MTWQGEFNWNELQTCDAQKAIDFYGESLGWMFEAEEMPSGGTYWLCLKSGKPVCGILTLEKSDGERNPDRWVTYIHVENLDEALARVADRGGVVLQAPWDVPGEAGSR